MSQAPTCSLPSQATLDALIDRLVQAEAQVVLSDGDGRPQREGEWSSVEAELVGLLASIKRAGGRIRLEEPG